jgi:hypothetical protein
MMRRKFLESGHTSAAAGASEPRAYNMKTIKYTLLAALALLSMSTGLKGQALTYCGWLNQTGTPITSFKTTWKVPPPQKDVPPYYNGLQLWSGLETNATSWFDTAGFRAMLAFGVFPFIGGGNYWWIASVYFGPDGSLYACPAVKVEPGQLVTAEYKLIGQSNGTYSYSLQFKGIPNTEIQIYDIPELTWCGEIVGGNYYGSCDTLPNTPFTPVTGIDVLTGTTSPQVNWTPTDLSALCGLTSVVVKNGGTDARIHIYW